MGFICIFLLYYYICSVICTVCLWSKFHSKENRDKLELDLTKFVSDIRGTYKDFSREDALVCFYLVTVFFSFILAPLSLVNKIIGKKNG